MQVRDVGIKFSIERTYHRFCSQEVLVHFEQILIDP